MDRRRAAAIVLATSLGLLAACTEKWDVADVKDQELDSAFFSGLNPEEIPNVPEPTRLRPCCILGHDIGARVGSIPVPGYEIRYVLDVNSLGTHQFISIARATGTRSACACRTASGTADAELGPGAGRPAARAGERSRHYE